MNGRDLFEISPGDRLMDYSVRELATAFHWTSKDDLRKALHITGSQLEAKWQRLLQADRALQQFYASELTKIIEYKKSNQ